MADLAALERRLAVLEDIEAIKRLKTKYWRCVDNKLWDDLDTCFADDAVADYGGVGICFRSKKEIMDYFRERSHARSELLIGNHHGHNPEIDKTSDTTAKGIWRLHFFRAQKQTNKRTLEFAYYHDEYVKEQGQWKIKTTKTTATLRDDFVTKGE
ncbi:MAG: nuclear transport factor 2 family protein [Chloroflexi bacterium]|nr:nuclear transport factor 2 family protein [Chloroflexota bacterium]